MTKKLKLFVWTDVLRDYTSGMIAVLAYDEGHARELAMKGNEWCSGLKEDLQQKPLRVTTPRAFLCHGGG